MSGPNSSNKKGMFENSKIRETLVKPYLRSIKVDPLGQFPLPDTAELPIPIDWHTGVEKIMKEDGYKDGPWFYKGAKMCLTWPIWHIAYPKAKWIIVRRPKQDIINSCLRTPFMKAYHNSDGWGKWVDHHLRCFEEMHRAGMDIHEVWSDLLVGGNYGELQTAIEYCGLEFNKQAIRDFITPELYTFVKE